jgi:hypothetical protein
MPFTALKDFFSEETRSQYCAGLSYTARTDKLLALVEKWVAEGKVKIGGPAAEVTGEG